MTFKDLSPEDAARMARGIPAKAGNPGLVEKSIDTADGKVQPDEARRLLAPQYQARALQEISDARHFGKIIKAGEGNAEYQKLREQRVRAALADRRTAQRLRNA